MRGFSVMYTLPLLPARPLPPIAIATEATAGSAMRDRAKGLLPPLHLGKGNVLCRFGRRGDQADVLLGKEALRNDDEQINRQSQRREEE